MKSVIMVATMLLAVPALAAEPVKLDTDQLDQVSAGRDRVILIDKRQRLNDVRFTLTDRFGDRPLRGTRPLQETGVSL